MSLVKLLKAPIKLFKKDVITFVMIRRYDLGILDDHLRYIAVRPNASISMLRQKVWHLLDLPDFCEEVILLKSINDAIIPLNDLRKGNDPHHPYILEVWAPRNRYQSSAKAHSNMLTIENGANKEQDADDTQTVDMVYEPKFNEHMEIGRQVNCSATTISKDSMLYHKANDREDRIPGNVLSDFNNDLTYPMSNCSLFKRKSRDNFTNIFLKIQNDLSNLNAKLTSLESRIPV